jgi:hypothetical protein
MVFLSARVTCFPFIMVGRRLGRIFRSRERLGGDSQKEMNMRNRVGWLALLSVLVVAGVLLNGLRMGAAPAPPANLEDTFKKAQVDGKYRMLLRQIKVDKDAETYQEFKDLGFRDRREYAGHKDLPAGHWVYAAPYWYIWRDRTSVQRPKRDWGPEQATGEPDTNMAGDIVTAWASATPDGQDEWLMLEYDEFVVPTAVLVYETYNPGSLVRVTAFKPDGEEVELWKGVDPTPPDAGMGVSEIPVKVDFKTNRVKLYIDSPNFPGWNEIDAVGVRDKAKKIHYAVAADASSTYAQPFRDGEDVTDLPRRNPAATERRIQKLEDEVRELKAALEELKKSVKKDK